MPYTAHEVTAAINDAEAIVAPTTHNSNSVEINCRTLAILIEQANRASEYDAQERKIDVLDNQVEELDERIIHLKDAIRKAQDALSHA